MTKLERDKERFVQRWARKFWQDSSDLMAAEDLVRKLLAAWEKHRPGDQVTWVKKECEVGEPAEHDGPPGPTFIP